MALTSTKALEIDALYAEDVAQQEIDGAMTDADHIEACICDLDIKIHELASVIEPQLPPTLKGSTVKISRSELAH